MTVQERNQQIETRFRTVREHLTHANPNDFDRQIPPNFVSCDWDCAQGSAIDCYSTDHPIIVTVSLQTSYLQPVQLGKTLYVKVTLQKVGRTLAYCAAEAWQQSGQLCVTTAGVYHLSPRPPMPKA